MTKKSKLQGRKRDWLSITVTFLVALSTAALTFGLWYMYVAGSIRVITWVAVPTTLVGQVDAAIGGKTAVNLPEAKNLVGAFHYPARVVADNRGMSVEDVRKLADGRVYTGRQAYALKLVDQLGYFEDAVDRAASLGGITGEPRVIEGRGPTQRHLLLRREEELDPGVLASLLEHTSGGLEHDDDRRLVVGAEDRPRMVPHDAVLAHGRLDHRLGRHRVRVRAQEDRRSAGAVRRRDPAVQVPRVAVETTGCVVLVPLEA